MYDKRYTLEGVQKLFKEKGLKAIIGEEIQKDFFETPTQMAELDDKTRKILLDLRTRLNEITDGLQQALS